MYVCILGKSEEAAPSAVDHHTLMREIALAWTEEEEKRDLDQMLLCLLLRGHWKQYHHIVLELTSAPLGSQKPLIYCVSCFVVILLKANESFHLIFSS